MKAGGRAIYLHPGWEQHSKHSVEKKGGGSPWGSRPSHSAQRRDWSQSPFCSERRRSAPDAMLALEHGSPREQNKAWQAGGPVGGSRVHRGHDSGGRSSNSIPCKRLPLELHNTEA